MRRSSPRKPAQVAGPVEIPVPPQVLTTAAGTHAPEPSKASVQVGAPIGLITPAIAVSVAVAASAATSTSATPTATKTDEAEPAKIADGVETDATIALAPSAPIIVPLPLVAGAPPVPTLPSGGDVTPEATAAATAITTTAAAGAARLGVTVQDTAAKADAAPAPLVKTAALAAAPAPDAQTVVSTLPEAASAAPAAPATPASPTIADTPSPTVASSPAATVATSATTSPARTDGRPSTRQIASVERAGGRTASAIRGPLAARAAFDASVQAGSDPGAAPTGDSAILADAAAGGVGGAGLEVSADAAQVSVAATPAPTTPQTAPLALASAQTTPAQTATTPVARTATADTVAGLAADLAKKLDAKTTRFQLTLNPDGLGRVDVSLAFGPDGATTATLAFDRADTAAQLSDRAGELQQALSQAGFDLPTSALRFDAPATAVASADPDGRSAWGGLGGGFSGGTGGDGQGQDGSGRGAPGLRAFAAADAHTLPPTPSTALRGLDIRI